MKALILCVSLFLIGCTDDKSVHYCPHTPGKTVWLNLKGWVIPIEALVTNITTDREGCWYHVEITANHLYPKHLLVHERHVR